MSKTSRREFISQTGRAAAGGLALGAVTSACQTRAAGPYAGKPNILFILADDLGYGDLGCYGQRLIQTPNLDRLAAQGIRFTQCYAASTVCAPSRCSLMTGLHCGHATVRGNGKTTLPATDLTVAEVLKSAGYTTGIIGKWGLGEPGTTGVPNRQGFDYFFGYLNHGHAHNYYPDYLWRNEEKVVIEGNVAAGGVASQRAQYAPDLFTQETLDFLTRCQAQPFFLYLAYTQPHANNELGHVAGNGMEVPDDAPYTNQPWPQPQKDHAAMITRLDRDVGRVLDHLKALGLEDKTIIFFSSDNGPHKEGGADPAFFNSSGGLRGYKRDLYDGGIRVPMIVYGPGHVPRGATSDHLWAFWDFLPTAAELAGAAMPAGLDGVSQTPTLLGAEAAGHSQREHDFLYWEFHERGFQQAARTGDWKAVRAGLGEPLEIYNLRADPGENNNVAASNPNVVARFETYFASARTESKDWPMLPRKK